jgi:dCMP deaminase
MNKKRLKEYDEFYMDIAIRVSKLSQAIRNKVGCILVKDKNIIAYGFNGMPTGMTNICEYKNKEGNLITKKEVIHSEENVFAKCAKLGISTDKSIMYITLAPCLTCARLILQHGIIKIIYKNDYRDMSGVKLLEKMGINIKKF